MQELRSKLSYEGIAGAIEGIESLLAGQLIDKRVARGIPLVAEEILLRYRDEFGESAPCTLETNKRFGVLTVRLSIKGPSLDVIEHDEYGEDDGDAGYGLGVAFVASVLGDGYGTPVYTYRNGYNVITMQARLQHSRPVWRDPMVVALFVSVLAGFAFRFLPSEASLFIVNNVVSRIVSLFMGVLSGITGPLVGLSLLTGICAFGSLAAFKQAGQSAILRMMGWSAVLIVGTAAMVLPFFRVLGGAGEAAFAPGELVDLLLSAIPTNIFTPFVENNALQIAVLSLFCGVCILALGDRADGVGKLIVELNGLVFKMMDVIATGLPMLVGLSMFKTIVSTDVSQLASLAKIVIISLAVTAIFGVAFTAWFCIRNHVPVGTFFAKIAPVLLIGATTGSSTAAMSENYRVCEDELGISEKLASFWIPLSQALFAPSLPVPLIVSMFAVAEMDGSSFSLSRLIVLFILVFQLSIASPKVPGGIAATFTILLAQLGLPVETAGLLVAANVFVCNPEVAFGLLVREIEISSLAIKSGSINRDTLTKL